jgi:hypothetical protein
VEAVDGLRGLREGLRHPQRVRLGHVPGDLEDAGAVAAALLQPVAEPADGAPVPALGETATTRRASRPTMAGTWLWPRLLAVSSMPTRSTAE